MEALSAADVVTERTIFSALAPAATAVHMQPSPRAERGLRAPSATSHAASPLLPSVGPQSANPRHTGSLTAWLPPKTPRSLLSSFPITADECAVVWTFLCDWVQTQVAMEAPATIPRFGTVSMKVRALNIRIPHFEPEQSFLDAFGLQATTRPVAVLPRTNSSSSMGSKNADKRQSVSPAAASQRSDAFAFSFLEMASCCGSSVDAAKAQEWLQAVIQKTGQAMNQCKRVELDIGVGVISCANRVVEQQMASRSTSVKPTLEYEIRSGESVVKRNILGKNLPLRTRNPRGARDQKASAVKYLTEPPSGRMAHILDSAQQEFIANYHISAEKAMLDYILLRERSRLRLGIPYGTPAHATLLVHWKWGDSTGDNGCLRDLKVLALKHKRQTASLTARERKTQRKTHSVGAIDGESRNRVHDSKTRRRQRVKTRLSTIYMLSDPLVRTLQALWHELEPSILLVNLPSDEMLSSSNAPLDLHAFGTEQLRHAAQAKAYLVEHWYWKAKTMIEDAVKSETYSVNISAAAIEYRTRHHFDAIGALMSLQIRSLIVKSVEAYVEFFGLFGKATGKDPISAENERQEDGHQHPAYSGLLISLAMQNGEVQFRDSLVDIPSHLPSVLHNLPQLFHNVGRIEAQFDEPLQFSTPSNPFLWNVTSQEDDIVLATIRIREIVEQNLSHLRQLQMDYAMFAQMHRHVCSIDIQELSERSDVATCRIEMEKVRATAVQVNSETHSKAYSRLFCVDRSNANTAILAGLAPKLAKKPVDLYELVDAEEFVASLKTTEISELQEKANAIKERIQFLLFERGSVRIDTPTGAGSGRTALPRGDAELSVRTAPNGSNLGLFRLSPDLLMSTAKTLKWRSHINRLLQDAEASLMSERARIETIFLAKRTRFQAEIEDSDGEVEGFAKKGDVRHAATYVVQLAKMKDTLLSFRKTMEAIVDEETKLQWKTTDFSKLDDIAEEMES